MVMTGNRKARRFPLGIAQAFGWLLLLPLALLMNGCAAKIPATGRIAPPPGVEEEKKMEGPAAGLLFDAERSLQAGDFGRAELQLERALRVEPRNARVWHLMARVRYGQHNYAQAVQLCLKANSLAGQDKALKKDTWLLMEQAYNGMGDSVKAEEARRKAQ